MDTPDKIYESIQALVRKEIDVEVKKIDQARRFQIADIPAHEHTGVDVSRINWANLQDRKYYIQVNLAGSTPATAANYGNVFIAPFACVLSSVRLVYTTASTSGTLQIEKLTGVQALDAGQTMLSATISMSATANTVYTGTLTNTIANTQLAIGDRIALKDAGTLTNLVGLCVILEITY